MNTFAVSEDPQRQKDHLQLLTNACRPDQSLDMSYIYFYVNISLDEGVRLNAFIFGPILK